MDPMAFDSLERAPLFRRCLAQCNLNNLLQVVGATGGIVGNYLVTQGNITGFMVWSVSNLALIWLQVRTRLYILVGLNMVYLYLCFTGIATWSRRSPGSIPAWIPSSLVEFSLRISGF
jgi:hypothetical protein